MQDIQKLISGFRRFQRQFFQSDDALYSQLRHQQNPKVLIIGCCDSRVDPAILTDCCPGDLFVIRNVANLVPPYEPDTHYHGVSSALEYAVRFLKVEHIIILGHSHCGGIDALMHSSKETPFGEFVDHWVDIARPAKEAVLNSLSGKSYDLQARACEQAAMLISLENLLTFPWITDQVEQGHLAIHGWYFDLEAGEMLHYDPQTGRFVKIAENNL